MFISFDGVEGASKTTQAKLLSTWLSQNYMSHVLTKEPGDPNIEECKIIREILLNPKHNISAKTEFLLYLADRAAHVDKCIKPALDKRQWVICDRYVDSTRIYQGIGRGLGVDEIWPMINFSSQGIMPDITFIMDIPVEFGLKRARTSNREFINGDRLENEQISFHIKLRQAFLDLAETHNRYIVLDATKSINELHEEIKNIISKYL